MRIPLIVYIQILFVGIVPLIAIFHYKLFAEFLVSLKRNSYFFSTMYVLWTLLLFPVDTGDAYKAGEQIGLVRIARIIIFIALFLSYLKYMMKHYCVPRRSVILIFFCYILVCSFSSIYSPSIKETVWKTFELIVLMMFALTIRKEILLNKLDQSDILRGILLLLFIVVYFCIIGGLLFPQIAYNMANVGEHGMSMAGIIPRLNPNSFGQFSAMIAFAGYYSIFFMKRLQIGYMAMLLAGIAGMVMAHSRTSAIALVLALLILNLFKGTMRTWFFVLLFSFFGFLLSEMVFEFLRRGQDTNLLMTMSGRTYMWDIAWEAFLEKPFLGAGYYAGHKLLDIKLGMPFSSVDNTYLEALVDVGVVGAFFLILFVFKIFWRTFSLFVFLRKSRSVLSYQCDILFGLLVIMIVRSFTGPSFQALNINLILLLLIAVIIDTFGMKRKIHKKVVIV